MPSPTDKTAANRPPRELWDAGAGPYRFWLDGGAGRALFAGGTPLWVFEGRGRRAVVRWRGGRVENVALGDPLEVLRRLLRTSPSPRAGAPFAGRAVGYWGYECARYFEPRFPAPGRAGPLPDFVWVMPGFWTERRTGARSGGLPPASKPTRPRGRAAYLAGVRRVLRYIAAGDIYQANLTHRLDLPFRGDPADFFEALLTLNPSPYACLMSFPGFALAGCSPELLLRARGSRVATRPIAGTRPRGATPARDRRLAGQLLLSAKERAEHVMLVDLERNDLGRVCRPGTVRVSERMRLESYSHVTHIVSQVEGRLAPGRDGLDALRALFPGGTVTGCPKVRSMEILNELEGGPRGPFYGSAGWVAADGDAELNILIRTAVFRGGTMSLRVGAGIVADSSPEREWQETLHKAGALLRARAEARRT